jgi:hypothetical protein
MSKNSIFILTENGTKPVPIGTIVYKPYQPAKVGKVVEDLGHFIRPSDKVVLESIRVVKVLWKDGTESKVLSLHLNNFETLVEDHKRKYEKFSKILETVRKL